MGTQSHCLVSLPSFAKPLPSIGSPSVRPLSLPSDPSPSSSSTTQMREIIQGRREEQKHVHTQGESDRYATTMSMLPDDVLLEIFDFCRKDQDYNILWDSWKWHLLAHVCHRWRQIVFASPRRLNLQIFCTSSTPVRNNLGIWPAFPIVVVYNYLSEITSNGEDNILAALRNLDRVCEVRLAVTGSQMGKLAKVMQEPFPVLTRLFIFSSYRSANALDRNVTTLPAGFLGGSAPCLQIISLFGIPYPELPTLLLSTSDLVKLDLSRIPPAGYISPEAMVESLAALPRLEIFVIGFEWAASRPYRIRPLPVIRTVLPTLTSFVFQGASEYLEDLVGRIDGPRLNHISISYFYRLVGFQVARLSTFIERSVGPMLTKCRHADVRFSLGSVTFDFCRRANDPDQDSHRSTIIISYEEIDWQVTPVSQVLSQFPATLSNVVHLELNSDTKEYQFMGPGVDWLHFLHQFSTVQTLLVHWAVALEDITEEMVTEALPFLELICLEGKEAPPVEKIVVVRQHSVYPVTVVNTIKEFRKRRESYIST